MAGMLLRRDELADHTPDQHLDSGGAALRAPRACAPRTAGRRVSAGGRMAGASFLPDPKWTESTMPTIVESVGGSAGRNGKLASLPRTQYTSSPVPAPVESVQITR